MVQLVCLQKSKGGTAATEGMAGTGGTDPCMAGTCCIARWYGLYR